jgi:hypothetical protein
MLRKLFPFIVLALVIPALVLATVNPNPKTVVRNQPVISGNESGPTGPVAYPPYPTPLSSSVDEIIGDTVGIGTTWYENQHNGTCGRMNTLEANGWRQFAWTKGENSGATVRHVWWNGIDPNGIQTYPGTGVAVESSIRAGFVNMDVGSNGNAFPGYHEQWNPGSPTLPWASASMDLITHNGAFLDFPTPDNPVVTQTIWPRIQIGQNQRIHMMCTNQVPAAANPQRMWYLSGTYDPVGLTVAWNPTWMLVDWTQTIACDVAVSPVTGSNKTLFAWTRSMSYPEVGEPDPGATYTQLNNDVYYLIDEDGLDPNFAQKINLTHFIPPNLHYLPDTLLANQDTLRAYTCLSTLIDHNNYAHIAFTVRSYFALDSTSYYNASLIYHWSEEFPTAVSVIANFFGDPSDLQYWADCGAWQVRAQRPSLGEDAAGILYCAYHVFDTDSSHLTEQIMPQGNNMGAPSGEIYVTKSIDGGVSWSQGINITNTITPGHALAGQSLSEITPTLAKKVDNYLHIEYVLDHDAGNSVQSEGTWTLNEVKYHRVPVSVIPSTPVVSYSPLHINEPPNAVPGVTPVSSPNTFALKAIYPNPFNPTATLTFTLDGVNAVALDVYNTRGELVANVLKGTYGPGEHNVTFDGTNLTSGVYYCKLTSGQRSAIQKMVMLK